jgi:transposase
MLSVVGSKRIYLYRDPTDMRKSFDGLTGIVVKQFKASILSGSIFVFVNRRRNRVKLLYFDGDGLAIFYKRLESGVFVLPELCDGSSMELSSAQLSMLLEGIVPLTVKPRWRANHVAPGAC